MSRFNQTLAASALAAAFFAAAPAHAAIDLDNIPGLGQRAFDTFASDPNGGDRSIGGTGELFVSIIARDLAVPAGANNRSYVRDLGLTSRTFVDALRGGTLGSLAFDFAPDAALTNFLATNAGLDISFNITAVHNISGFDPVTFFPVDVGMLTTSGESAASTSAKGPQNLAGYTGAEQNVVSFVQGVNLRTDGSPSGNTALNLSATFLPGEFGFHDNNFGGSSTFGFNTEGGVGSMTDFYFYTADNDASSAIALGTWSLLNDGTLQFAATAPIPVPAAVWLFSSAAMFLGGLRRRRNA